MPLCIIPERGQVPENSVKPPNKEVCDVFHDDVTGSKFANETGVFEPQSGPRAVEAIASSGSTDVLAGEPATDDVNANSICRDVLGAKLSDIGVTPHLWPMLREDPATVWLNLTERDRLEAAGSL
jgi:hypothetical protein